MNEELQTTTTSNLGKSYVPAGSTDYIVSTFDDTDPLAGAKRKIQKYVGQGYSPRGTTIERGKKTYYDTLQKRESEKEKKRIVEEEFRKAYAVRPTNNQVLQNIMKVGGNPMGLFGAAASDAVTSVQAGKPVGIIDAAMGPAESAGRFVVGTAGQFTEGVGKAAGGIGDIFNGIVGQAPVIFKRATFQPVTDEEQQLFNEAQKDFMHGGVDTMSGIFQSIYSPIAGGVQALPEDAQESIAGAVGFLGEQWNKAGQAAGIDTNSEEWKYFGDNLLNLVTIASVGLASSSGKAARTGKEGLVTRGARKTAEGLKKMANKASKRFGQYVDDFFNKIDDAKPAEVSKAIKEVNAKYTKGATKQLDDVSRGVAAQSDDVLRGTSNQIDDAARAQVAQQAGKKGFLKNIKDEAIAKATGTDVKDLDQLRRAATMKTAQGTTLGDDVVRGTVNKATLYDDVVKLFDDLDDTKGQFGKAYEPIKNSSKTVKLKPNTLKDAIKKTFDLDEIGGKLVETRSTTLGSAEINKLNKLLNTYGSAKTLNMKEFFALRNRLTKFSKFETAVSKTDDFMNGSRNVREAINSVAHKQLPELAKLDRKFSGIKDTLKPIKKMIESKETGRISAAFDEDAVLKLLGKTEKAKMAAAQLDKLAPGFIDKLKTVKAWENVKYAGTANAVGTYGRNIAAGTALLSGNPLLAAGLVMSNPQIAAKMIMKSAKIKSGLGAVGIGKTASNLGKGIGKAGEVISKTSQGITEAVTKSALGTAKEVVGEAARAASKLPEAIPALEPLGAAAVGAAAQTSQNLEYLGLEPFLDEDYKMLRDSIEDRNSMIRKQIDQRIQDMLNTPEKRQVIEMVQNNPATKQALTSALENSGTLEDFMVRVVEGDLPQSVVTVLNNLAATSRDTDELLEQVLALTI